MYPRTIGHIGINVKNIEKSLEWYCKVFGFQPLTPVEEVDVTDGSADGERLKNILGKGVKKFKIARICAGAGLGIEFFQYMEMENGVPDKRVDIYHPGWVHICIVDEKVEELVKRITDNGGKQKSDIHFDICQGIVQPYKCVYCEDPEGNLIEVTSHGPEMMYANMWRDAK
jgi:catechol 2,3-dioxygenase-like lactoylglutathione lyase family enzyme